MADLDLLFTDAARLRLLHWTLEQGATLVTREGLSLLKSRQIYAPKPYDEWTPDDLASS